MKTGNKARKKEDLNSKWQTVKRLPVMHPDMGWEWKFSQLQEMLWASFILFVGWYDFWFEVRCSTTKKIEKEADTVSC